jgi:hypothetical protein
MIGFSLTPTGKLSASLGDIQCLLPLPTIAMTETHNINAALARVAKIQQEIKTLKNIGQQCIVKGPCLINLIN